MDFSASTLWWMVAGGLVIAELTTGTFYLLMVAFGMATGAIAAHVGLEPVPQVITAAVCGGGATALWHWTRLRQPSSSASQDKGVNLDIGEQIQVTGWLADGTARVTYRGTQWQARLSSGSTARPGAHRITAVEGNWLVLTPSN